MQLSDFRLGVWDRLGVRTNDPAFPSPTVTRFVNAALREMSSEHAWPWLATSETISTVAGTDSYSPADVHWMATNALVVMVSNVPYPLARVERDVLDDDYDSVVQRQPEAFAVYADQLVVRPIPDAVYTLTHRYQRAEKVLASDSDTPYLPDAYADVVIDLALAITLGRSKEEPRAVAALGRYSAWLADMTKNSRRGSKPTRIRIRPGSWL
jgi:hypothetical protein